MNDLVASKKSNYLLILPLKTTIWFKLLFTENVRPRGSYFIQFNTALYWQNNPPKSYLYEPFSKIISELLERSYILQQSYTKSLKTAV